MDFECGGGVSGQSYEITESVQIYWYVRQTNFFNPRKKKAILTFTSTYALNLFFIMNFTFLSIELCLQWLVRSCRKMELDFTLQVHVTGITLPMAAAQCAGKIKPCIASYLSLDWPYEFIYLRNKILCFKRIQYFGNYKIYGKRHLKKKNK